MAATRIILLPGLDGIGAGFGPLLGVIPPQLSTQVISYPVDQPRSYDNLLGVIGDQLATDGQVALIAESFSGLLALRYAVGNRQRVKAVVLCGGFIRSPLPRWLRHFTAFPFHLLLPAFLVRRCLVGSHASDELVEMVQQSIQQVPPRVFAGRAREAFDVDCSAELRQCACPVMYLGASHDVMVRRASIEAIQAVRSDVRFRMIDASHLLLRSEPVACWQEIQQFFRDVGVAVGW